MASRIRRLLVALGRSEDSKVFVNSGARNIRWFPGSAAEKSERTVKQVCWSVGL